MPPTSSAPSTTSSPALSPTAATYAGLPRPSAMPSAPITSVTRPSASVTVVRVRSGRRCPRATPSPAPSRTVATFSAVPVPGTTRPASRPGASWALPSRARPGSVGVRAHGTAKGVPTAALSRGIAGIAGQALVVNLPGSRGGVRDGLAVVVPLLRHAVEQIVGSDH